MVKLIDDIKIYFLTIPAHKFLHIKNYDSNGYWDFWQKQNLILGQDQTTICSLLDNIKGKLDGDRNGQIMAYINDPNGRFCDWGIPRIECWGIRLPLDYDSEIPPNMFMIEIPKAEYLVFEHGPFDGAQESCNIENKIEKAMKTFDFSNTNYNFDTSTGGIIYFYYDPEHYFKYIRPVKINSN